MAISRHGETTVDTAVPFDIITYLLSFYADGLHFIIQPGQLHIQCTRKSSAIKSLSLMALNCCGFILMVILLDVRV